MSKSVNIVENQRGSGVSSSVALATRTITITSSSYTASGGITTIDFPVVKTRYNTTSGGRNAIDDSISLRAVVNGNYSSRGWCSKWAKVAVNTDATLTVGSSSATRFNFNTSSLFNSSNKTEKTLPISWELMAYTNPLHTGNMASDGSMTYIGYYETTQYSTYATITGEGSVTLDAPPTFDTTQVSFNTNGAYVGLTTASITVSNLSIKYGGDIASGYFTVGNQTEPFSENGVVSMLLDSAGTFTPTVTVTDSRGQTTTKTLDAITVNSYVAPEVSFTLERTNSSGTKDDEGTYAVATGSFNWTDAIATLSQPTVSAIDSDGTTLSVSATWYTDRALTTAVDWSSTSSWSSPKVLYGKIGTLPVNESSQITVTPNDSEGSGTAQTQTLASAFYTIDFLAGGHGIAFGQPASQTGLHCDMEATFNRTVDVGEEVSSENLLLQLDTTATSGTDKEIYDALVSLGWDSDCIV